METKVQNLENILNYNTKSSIIFNAFVDILIEKGVITSEEITKKLSEKGCLPNSEEEPTVDEAANEDTKGQPNSVSSEPSEGGIAPDSVR